MESQQAAPTGESVDITTLPYLLQDLQDILRNISEASQQPSHGCTHCEARFVSEYGLHMHVTRMHRDKVDRYIPGDFDRSLHAKDGMPICAACGRSSSSGKVCAITCSPGPAPDRISYDPSPPHLKHRFRVKF